MTFNEHFQKQVDSANCELLPEDVKNDVISDFNIMSQLGIDNNEDQNIFFLVRNKVPEIIHYIFKTKLSDNVTSAIAAEVFRNREKAPIGTLLELIEATDLALKKMVPGHIKPKIAYPQSGAITELPKYDIGRWVAATREIYSLMNKGHNQGQAKQAVIGNWEAKEQMDYDKWLKFYKERTPEKYPKLAALGQDNDGLFLANLPIGVNSLRARHVSGKFPNPIESIKEPPGLPQTDVNSARDKIEGQRKKLISRLNSAEKMLASLDGQLFAGDDQELMLKLLQDLKRRIQIANKLTTKSSLFVDHIYRTANLLEARGKADAAGFFYKLAQLEPMGSEPPVGLDPPAGPMPTEAAPAKGNTDDTYECLKEFFDNLNRGVSDKNDTPEEREHPVESTHQESPTPPTPPSPPTPAIAAIEVDDTIKIGAGYWHPSIKLAQKEPFIPRPAVGGTQSQPTQADKNNIPDDNTEDVIDAALKNISINDVMSRLEMLVSVYNKREIARQLAILDIMMDRLGLSSFFPALGEAMGKALESNQYIASRLEGVLTRLKGSIDVPGASEWIEPKTVEISPENMGIKNNLQKKKDEEEQRKELRKQQDLSKMQGGAGPDAAIPVGETEDLQKPVSRIERAPKIDVR